MNYLRKLKSLNMQIIYRQSLFLITYLSNIDYLRKLKSLNMQITYSQYGLLAQVEIIKYYRFSLPLGKI